jgi:hypothetical protein
LDQALRIAERERLEEDGVDGSEHSSVNADAEGDCQDGGSCEQWAAAERTEGEAHLCTTYVPDALRVSAYRITRCAFVVD